MIRRDCSNLQADNDSGKANVSVGIKENERGWVA